MENFNGYKKGVNLGGWLSQCDHTKERYDGFIRKEDIEKISSWGADHVRLPIDYDLLETDDGTPKDDGFKYIDDAVRWCREYGLNMIIDLHKTAGYSFDKGENESGFFESKELQERFYSLWERIAKRYGNYSDRICFELLNEVTDKSFCEAWNRVAKSCIERIRKIAPDTVILVGGYWNNSPEAVKDLDPPYDDKVVYNCHCYDPLDFTHQGAQWVDGMKPDFRIRYSECGLSAEYFAERFKEASETAAKYNTVLYCGEYGVIENAEPEDIIEWYKAIHSAFEQMGICRATWSYKEMNFGLSDERLSGFIDELIKYL